MVWWLTGVDDLSSEWGRCNRNGSQIRLSPARLRKLDLLSHISRSAQLANQDPARLDEITHFATDPEGRFARNEMR
jgi:hypothetical protein